MVKIRLSHVVNFRLTHRDGLAEIFRGKREKTKGASWTAGGMGSELRSPYGLPPFTPHPAPHWPKAMGKNNCRQRVKIVDAGHFDGLKECLIKAGLKWSQDTTYCVRLQRAIFHILSKRQISPKYRYIESIHNMRKPVISSEISPKFDGVPSTDT